MKESYETQKQKRIMHKFGSEWLKAYGYTAGGELRKDKYKLTKVKKSK